MKTALQALAVLLSAHLALGADSWPDVPSDVLTNLEHYWSYGRSPAVYPSREFTPFPGSSN